MERKNWKIYDSMGNHINTIYGYESNVKKCCEMLGNTYEYDSTPIQEQPPNSSDIGTLSQRLDLVEDCIAEMAMQVYKEE